VADQRFAVIIGVDHAGREDSLPSLRYAVKDARSIHEVLCDPDIGTFHPDDVTLFIGDQVSAAEIKTTLRRLVLASDTTDVLLIYFAGHTLAPAWSHGTDVYLMTPDLDESTLAHDPDAGLRMAFLKRDVLAPFAGTALLILDCCRAGSLLATARRDIDMVSVGGRDESRYNALMACTGDSVAREDAALGHGVVTHHVLRALRGHGSDRQGVVTFQSMSSYVLEQHIEPQPGVTMRAWGTNTLLTRPGPHAAGVGRHVVPPMPEIYPLEGPLDRHAAGITELIDRLSRCARDSHRSGAPAGNGTPEDPIPRAARVQYVKSATGAESVALLEYTPTGFTTIDATARFDQAGVQSLLHATSGGSDPLDPVWFGHASRMGGSTMVCLPVRRGEGKVLLLALVNPPAALVAIGQPLAKVIEAVWRTDFAASPAEAEVGVLTALRETFGRLPTSLYERCFRLYRQILDSFAIVFQPVITIGPAHQQVGVHSYEALARRYADDQRAPVAMLQVAHAWGDRFVVERDTIILVKALEAYARAHEQGPWDVPKPVSVNVSVRSLLSDSFINTAHAAVAAAHLDAGSVTLEISEQDPIEPRAAEDWPDEPHAHFHKRLVAVAREVGIAFAVDDFGAGYASLSRMAELPLTQIKVDRAILHHPQALQELSLVVAVARDHFERGQAHAARIVIIEGVDDESPVTLRQIYERNIKHVQGYITREPAAPWLRRLRPEARKEIAARVRGDDGHRSTGLARGDGAGGRHPVRRSA
jgi:EAL domain-containing protein (putative c-di-GMP-specific phosphodiesterase class I)